MSFFCKSCDAEIDAPYEWGGMSIGCPACGLIAPLQYKNGQRIAMSASGYGLSFKDFVALLSNQGWREEAQPLIAELLACSIKQREKGFVLVSKGGAAIPYEHAHLSIQANSVSQRQLYNLAMGLWR